MPKVSGYRQAKDALLSYIIEKCPKIVQRPLVATQLDISISTAGNYLQMLASEFPNSLSYTRGTLEVTNPIPLGDIPADIRLKNKELQIKQVKELTSKILSNHLNHKDREKLKGAILKLKEKIDAL